MNKKIKVGDKQYSLLVLLIERRTCTCSAISYASAGTFLEEETRQAKHLIRMDRVEASLIGIAEQVKTEVRHFDSKVFGCSCCFQHKADGFTFNIPREEEGEVFHGGRGREDGEEDSLNPKVRVIPLSEF